METLDFALAPGEQLFFEIVNRAGRATLADAAGARVGPLYVTIRRML